MRALPTLIAIAFAALAAAAPASAAIDNTSGDAVIVIAGDVTVEPGEAVDDVFVVKGHARILGRVEGDVVVVDGDADVRGRSTATWSRSQARRGFSPGRASAAI